MIKLGIAGLCGRMGYELFACAGGSGEFEIVCGIDRDGKKPHIGCTAEIKEHPGELSVVPDLFIDFSRPECSVQVLGYAKEKGIPVVLGTTGFTDAQKKLIEDTAASVPVVFAANFSVGVNVLLLAVEKTAAVMADSDIEIVEAHHRYKVDAPSGTALAMGEAAARGRGVSLKDVKVSGRDGITGERVHGTIGFSAVRGGDIVGEHKAMFCSDGERVEIGHVAQSRATFAHGALRAARWLSGRQPGLYTMKDVLSI